MISIVILIYIKILFNYIFENSTDIMFYSIFATTAGSMVYSLIKSYINSYHEDKGIQTDSWEDFSERANQLASDSVTSIDTVTPRISPTEHLNPTNSNYIWSRNSHYSG